MTNHALTAKSVLKYLDNPRTDLARENDADPTSVSAFALVHATLALNESVTRIADALERAHPVSNWTGADGVAKLISALRLPPEKLARQEDTNDP